MSHRTRAQPFLDQGLQTSPLTAPTRLARLPTPLTGKSRCGQFAGQAGLIRPLCLEFPPPAMPFLILASLSLGLLPATPAFITAISLLHLDLMLPWGWEVLGIQTSMTAFS